MSRLPETGDVADEVTGLLLAELDAADVGRLLRETAVVDIDSGELRVRECRRDVVERPELEQDANRDDEAVARLCRGLKVRLAVVRRVRNEDAAVDTTGVPCAMASSSTRPCVSVREANTNTFAAASRIRRRV